MVLVMEASGGVGGCGGLFVCYDGVGCVKWNTSGTLRIGLGNHRITYIIKPNMHE